MLIWRPLVEASLSLHWEKPRCWAALPKPHQSAIILNKNLFLMGYSEGSYVTMAAQREIENNASHGRPMTAAAEEAGGYDLTGMATTFARFQAAGATNVEFFPIPNGTHQTSIVPMMASALPWLQSLDK